MKLLINGERIVSLGSSYMSKFIKPHETEPNFPQPDTNYVVEAVAVMTEEEVLTQWAEDNLAETDTFEIVSDEFIPLAPAPTKSDLENYLAQKRWEIETGGTVFNGMTIPTDDRAKILLEGAAEDLTDTETTSFKVNGQWATLSGLTMRAVRNAMRAHIKACFAKEAEISSLINSDDPNIQITTKAQIDAANWPS